MNPLTDFLNHFNWMQLVFLLISTAATLLCLTVHELCHGFTAYCLGDPTAKRAGRLTLKPLAHIDPVGFIMMLLVHVGWAKPVPVDIRYLKKPKRDMAITALAGPASNFFLACLALLLGDLVLYGPPVLSDEIGAWIIVFLCYVAVFSVGLGLFNLIPIPPLDGSKVLFSVLPNRMYYGYLCYERYLLVAVVALAWFGVFAGPLDTAMGWVLRGLCALTRFPFEIVQYYFGL